MFTTHATSNQSLHFLPVKSSSAVLSFVPSCSDFCNLGALSPPSLTLFLAASFKRWVSASLVSFVFNSFSSSLSPTLKGSFSSGSGCAATDVRGCHFFAFDPLFGDVARRSAASTSSTGPDWGGAGVDLKRSGFACGRDGFGGGAS